MALAKYTDEQRKELIERIKNGESQNSVSKETGIANATLRKWLRRDSGLDLKPKTKRKGKKSRFSEKFRNEAVSRVLNGEKISKVSKDVGVSYETIKNWRNSYLKAIEATTPTEKAESEKVLVFDTNETSVQIGENEKGFTEEVITEKTPKESVNKMLLEKLEFQSGAIADLQTQLNALKDSQSDKKNEPPEAALLLHIEHQNLEIVKLQSTIIELQDEIKMLKKTAILMSKELEFNE